MNTIELLPPVHVSELRTTAAPPWVGESPPERPSATAILIMVWLSFLKFWALLLLAVVVIAPIVPGLVVLAIVMVVVAPPYLVLRRLRGDV